MITSPAGSGAAVTIPRYQAAGAEFVWNSSLPQPAYVDSRTHTITNADVENAPPLLGMTAQADKIFLAILHTADDVTVSLVVNVW